MPAKSPQTTPNIKHATQPTRVESSRPTSTGAADPAQVRMMAGLQDCIITVNNLQPKAEDNPKFWDICWGKCLFSVNSQDEQRKVNVILQLHQHTAYLILHDENYMQKLDLQNLHSPEASDLDFMIKWNNPDFENLTLRFAHAEHVQVLYNNVTRTLAHMARTKRMAAEMANIRGKAITQPDISSSTADPVPPMMATASIPLKQSESAEPAAEQLIIIDQPQTSHPTPIQESTQDVLLREFSVPHSTIDDSRKPDMLIEIDDEASSLRDKLCSITAQAIEPLFRMINEISDSLKNISEEARSQAMAGILEAVDRKWRDQNWLISDTDIALLYGAIQGMVNFKHDVNSVSAAFVTNQNDNKHDSNRYSRLVYKSDFIEGLQERATNLADHMKTLEFPRRVQFKLGSRTGNTNNQAPKAKGTSQQRVSVFGGEDSTTSKGLKRVTAKGSTSLNGLDPEQPAFVATNQQQTSIGPTASAVSANGTTASTSATTEGGIPVSITSVLAAAGRGLGSSRWA